MRVVDKNEKEKRGCLYCLDYKKVRGTKNRMCKHDECPFRELDEFESYEDFFKAQGNVLAGLFEEGAE